MKHLGKYLNLLAFLVILFSGCKKDERAVVESRVLFSVDLDNQIFNRDDLECYISAYTSDGKLLNYGNLSDSLKWILKGECEEDTIDILYFEIAHENSLFIYHVKNICVGHSFEDNTGYESHTSEHIDITLKVEDFGNHSLNNTALTTFEIIPSEFHRGYTYTGEFGWKNIEDGYGYKSSWIDLDPKYQGSELLIFERGTNIPYLYYLDIPVTDIHSDDTITLNKSDFSPCEIKTIQIISADDKIDRMRFYTYNKMDEKKDLITSFDQGRQDVSGEYSVSYIVNDILPIDKWMFNYYGFNLTPTTYRIGTNKEIPSSIEINGLTGYSILKTGNQFSFTHGNIFPDKDLAHSVIGFTKSCLYYYYLYFDKSESRGNTSITPFEIPHEILAKYNELSDFNSLEWEANYYAQVYTNLHDRSPLEYLENSIIKKTYNTSSTGEYIWELFGVNF